MKNTKKLLSLLLVIAMIFALAVPAFAEGETPSMAGKTVIVHSNDVHGAIAGYANIAALAAEYESQGAKVIVADAGDFSQGKVEVSSNKGLNAVKMMNAAGYDIAPSATMSLTTAMLSSRKTSRKQHSAPSAATSSTKTASPHSKAARYSTLTA